MTSISFYMIHRPPTSTPFPTRRSSDLCPASVSRCSTWATTFTRTSGRPRSAPPGGRRSEEHTSELQSLTNLVCRLLLENKNMLSSLLSNIVYINNIICPDQQSSSHSCC